MIEKTKWVSMTHTIQQTHIRIVIEPLLCFATGSAKACHISIAGTGPKPSHGRSAARGHSEALPQGSSVMRPCRDEMGQKQSTPPTKTSDTY